jgi:hypothetical protein
MGCCNRDGPAHTPGSLTESRFLRSISSCNRDGPAHTPGSMGWRGGFGAFCRRADFAFLPPWPGLPFSRGEFRARSPTFTIVCKPMGRINSYVPCGKGLWTADVTHDGGDETDRDESGRIGCHGHAAAGLGNQDAAAAWPCLAARKRHGHADSRMRTQVPSAAWPWHPIRPDSWRSDGSPRPGTAPVDGCGESAHDTTMAARGLWL